MLIFNFLWALTLTEIVELTVAYLLGFRKKSIIITIISVNLITNPVLNYLLLLNYHFSFIKHNLIIILFLEMVMVFVEWKILVYALIDKPKNLFKLSLIMNFCSYISGVFIFEILGIYLSYIARSLN